jgi:hypothetical protein
MIDRNSDTWIEISKVIDEDRKVLQQKIASHLATFEMTQFYRGQLAYLEKLNSTGKNPDARQVTKSASIY